MMRAIARAEDSSTELCQIIDETCVFTKQEGWDCQGCQDFVNAFSSAIVTQTSLDYLIALLTGDAFCGPASGGDSEAMEDCSLWVREAIGPIMTVLAADLRTNSQFVCLGAFDVC